MAHAQDIDRHVRTYLMVFGALLVLTFVTVAVSYFHLPVLPAIALALFIATVKGSLVACYFMHLISERKLIYAVMALSVVFFFFCLLIPAITDSDNIHAAENATFDVTLTPEIGGHHDEGHAAADDHGDDHAGEPVEDAGHGAGEGAEEAGEAPAEDGVAEAEEPAADDEAGG